MAHFSSMSFESICTFGNQTSAKQFFCQVSLRKGIYILSQWWSYQWIPSIIYWAKTRRVCFLSSYQHLGAWFLVHSVTVPIIGRVNGYCQYTRCFTIYVVIWCWFDYSLSNVWSNYTTGVVNHVLSLGPKLISYADFRVGRNSTHLLPVAFRDAR